VIVLDASALTDFLLGREHALDALTELLAADTAEPAHAPELIEPETLSALRKLVLRGDLSNRRAGLAVADMDDVRLIRYPHAALRPRVWKLRSALTPYDATYLALAEALGASTLVTADGGLASCARRSLGSARVVQLA
jgi:predicted nucleic acid-binding protein